MEKKIAVAKRRVFLDFFFLSERTIIMNNFEILELELDSLGKKILHCCAEKTQSSIVTIRITTHFAEEGKNNSVLTLFHTNVEGLFLCQSPRN